MWDELMWLPAMPALQFVKTSVDMETLGITVSDRSQRLHKNKLFNSSQMNVTCWLVHAFSLHEK